MQSEWWTCHSH